jgi:hypothetical protein
MICNQLQKVGGGHGQRSPNEIRLPECRAVLRASANDFFVLPSGPCVNSPLTFLDREAARIAEFGWTSRARRGALFETQEHAPNLMCPPFPLAGGSQNAAPVQFVSDAAQRRYAIGLNALDDGRKVGRKPARPRRTDLVSAVAMRPRWRFANTATGRERFCVAGHAL